LTKEQEALDKRLSDGRTADQRAYKKRVAAEQAAAWQLYAQQQLQPQVSSQQQLYTQPQLFAPLQPYIPPPPYAGLQPGALPQPDAPDAPPQTYALPQQDALFTPPQAFAPEQLNAQELNAQEQAEGGAFLDTLWVPEPNQAGAHHSEVAFMNGAVLWFVGVIRLHMFTGSDHWSPKYMPCPVLVCQQKEPGSGSSSSITFARFY
jgi:hypothetical protein